ncbi:MAG: SusD/RagB family nutrient-binding outer membrane lipoprotein [Cyclobacteriaceae bacterium]|nr:SusD/RagB family nutrient-binding outer membrane lipoprotein [Cyclobacteriaceae bacterium]
MSTILPVTQMSLFYEVVGGDMSLYLAVWSQLVTGVHAQLHSADRFVFDNTMANNTWNSTYTITLKNLKIVMEKADESGASHYKGVAQVLYAYTASILTDSWGQIPYSDAVLGAENTSPAYDDQEVVYTAAAIGILAMLDDAIANCGSTNSTATPGSDDLVYGGNMGLWVKAANAVKAKCLTRLANTSAYSAAEVITSVNNSFTNTTEAFVFRGFIEGATTEHPWFQEENDRAHFATSESLFNLMGGKNDPRAEFFFDDGASSTPAPNGAAELDQGGDFYTKMYDIVNADSPLEIVTYDQLKFFEAEAYLSLGNTTDANTAYEEGVNAALARYGVDAADITTYTAQSNVFPGAGALSLDDIHEQRYISYYPFQSIEAYSSWRRTNIPALVNPNGDIPRRVPAAQSELDANSSNVPAATTANGVWWDDGTEN